MDFPAAPSARLDPLLAHAQSLLEMGLLSEAEQTARQYLREHANSADGHYLLGFILFRQAKAKDSLAEYTEGAKYRTPSAFDLKVVACDYVVLEDYSDADKWFTKSAEWNPKDRQAWYYLGRTKYNENRFDEAIQAFNECLKLDPKNVKAEDNLGLCYAALGRTDEAITAYQTAIGWQAQATTKNSGPLIDLGSVLIETDRAGEAIPYLVEAAGISPKDFTVHRELGKAYLHVNETKKAQAELEKAVQLAPENGPLHFMLGKVYRKEGLSEKAKIEFDRVAALNGEKSQDPTVRQ
ncbi:MAG: tetratricopeptide repeat protein [Acidobacteriaceae bacterium]|nr:tetratricopeptide repeat protein [Acidobacteriaceae bacterium]MBV9782100.1 tetratricopeptide repeat protein [Acidobacteriaceae bacterium]